MAVTAPTHPPSVSAWPFVRLKLRLLANGLRGRPARIILFLVGVLAAGLFAVAGYAALAVPGVLGNERAAGMALPLAGAGILLGWLFFPLLFFGVDESLDPARFALLPLRRRTLITGLFAAALTGLPAIATLVATAGMVDTAARLGGAGAAAAQLAGVVTGLLLCVAVSRAVTSAFATGLRSRRSRDLAVILLAVVASLIGPLQLGVLAAAQRADADTVATVAAVLGWTPVGAPWSVGLDVVAGRYWAVPVKLAVAVVTVVALLRWWSSTLEQAMVGAAAAAGGRATAAGDPVDLLLFRRLPRTRFGALVAREARYWWRETRRRAALITFAAAGIFLPLSLAITSDGEVGAAGFLGAVAAIALANQFGYDGNAYAANVIAAVPGRLEVQSRAAAHALFVLPVLVVAAVVFGVAAGHPGAIPGQLGLLVAGYGAGLGLVLPLSVRAAYAVPESTSPFALSSGGGTAKGLLAVGVLFGTVLATLPLMILSWTLDGVWPWIGLPVGVAYGAAGYLIGSAAAGDQLDRRMPELLATVTPGR